jgi:hypothetical protein
VLDLDRYDLATVDSEDIDAQLSFPRQDLDACHSFCRKDVGAKFLELGRRKIKDVGLLRHVWRRLANGH